MFKVELKVVNKINEKHRYCLIPLNAMEQLDEAFENLVKERIKDKNDDFYSGYTKKDFTYYIEDIG